MTICVTFNFKAFCSADTITVGAAVITYHCTDPSHERALSNMAVLNGLKEQSPEQFIDEQLPYYEYDTMNMGEREVYEATCREGRPYVSVRLGVDFFLVLYVFFCRHEVCVSQIDVYIYK